MSSIDSFKMFFKYSDTKEEVMKQLGYATFGWFGEGISENDFEEIILEALKRVTELNTEYFK
jgi:hypothetical protein